MSMEKAIPCKILISGMMIITLLLAGCGTSPPAKFYTLMPVVAQKPPEKVVETDKYTPIGIGPVEIPEYLDRPEIVTRAEQNQLILSEFNLWGGVLKADINRVLLENISALLAGDGIPIITWKTANSEVHKVPVLISRFDGSLNDGIALRATWAVLEKEGKAFEFFRESNITIPVKGSSYSSIVTAMSEALGELSKEIAAGIKSVVKKK
jgi:uncharacterized lipoprotein YmbA